MVAVDAGETSVGLSSPLRAGEALDRVAYADLRRRLVLDGCKWDPQVGDVNTVASFPLIMSARQWRIISRLAENLAAEQMRAEAELVRRPELQRRLGMPRRLRRVLREGARCAPTAVAGRILRFDFHWTRQGWRISEVNSDVPGGYTEASNLPRMMAEYFPGMTTAGDPAETWADAIYSAAGTSRPIALLAAAGFMEDQQIVAYLGKLLSRRGAMARLATPQELKWSQGAASLGGEELGAIVRFFQAEWLAKLPARCGWQNFFFGGRTPVANAGVATLTESKRLPLVWGELSQEMPTWRRLLPETRDPREAPWRRDDGWLIKSAYCNTGDTVAMRSLLNSRQWRSASMAAWLFPNKWLAQRRFEALPVDSPMGEVYPCVGVYTIDGRAAGAYVRVSPRPVIDFSAVDVALLIEGGDD